MGAQYGVVREYPDQPTVPPPPTLPRNWPARNPVPTFNSFSVLAEIEDATAWLLPTKPGNAPCTLRARCSTCCCKRRTSRQVRTCQGR